jgi:hypothetical protein
MQAVDNKAAWNYTVQCKFTSVSQACTCHLYHYHNQHSVLLSVTDNTACCDRQKSHYLLNLEYDSGDILECIIRVKNFDSHHNKVCSMILLHIFHK